MSDLRGKYVERIWQAGVALSTELATAFATVAREAFVPEGFQRPDGTWAQPDDPDFLELVYRDDVLVTKVDGRVPVSSSSQPSLMALMIEALAVRPGHRVLEIGSGTGYNAALLAALGAAVTTVDVQEDVADRARSALARVGAGTVRVVHGDGYAGVPGETFDRVIVTVGVSGLSPHWIEQLAPDGIVVVPVEHAGTEPVLAVRTDGDRVTAKVVSPAGFMTAAGPLTAVHTFPAPAAPGTLTEFTQHAEARFDPPLHALAYRDLWYAAGVWYRRTTLAAVPGREQNCLILLDEDRSGGAIILPDGSVHAGGARAAEYAHDATVVLDHWLKVGRPPIQRWQLLLTRAGDPGAPLWLPTGWEM